MNKTSLFVGAKKITFDTCFKAKSFSRTNIAIFDEATLNLDYETERRVQNSLDKIKGKTILVSAHRLSTLKNMDKILVMKSGRVIEQGTYDELLKKQGHFYKLLKQQGGWKKKADWGK